ncbi:glycoside hydrolase family 32 protein [Rathayibacter sp. ZW T2_19]|uniref:Glycoside hydrolase family 32 protein n=1 Tax=Rathayibacter rubneri TaxID=2950106 RepID=A0A9X2E391_9MICO|nr:glycoside hydrolase family 32 protein [Rathayibacter rubneri]MCM6763561.1 glycoside hydrolase family 32 protein [Rathayibacter rubneri]
MTATTLSTRPAVHFAPARHWMNDPNGLVFLGGRYHLYFQHNPNGADWGDMSWGHASSTDLRTWTEHPVALLHDEHEGVFSGSIVVDHANSSGFGSVDEPPLVALYTSARERSQSQALAWSLDGGETWTKHGVVLDRGTTDFRDPKVIRYGDHWILAAVEALDRQVHLFRSDDLLSWTPLSVFGPAGATDGIWECPDLFPLDGRWVLALSMNPGHPSGGSGMQYFVGDFDGTSFTATSWDWLDRGRDFYAGVTVSGSPEPVMIGWMSNWDYAHAVPTSPWRGSAALPRRLSLRGERLVQLPAAELHEPVSYRVGPQELGAIELPEQACGRALRLRLAVRSDSPVEIVLRGSEDGSHGPVVRLGGGVLSIDRRASGETGFSDAFASVSSAPLSGERLEIDVWVDATSVEVFADGGALVLSELVFPRDEDVSVRLRGEGAMLEWLEATVLEA